jgi:hypothetical protein
MFRLLASVLLCTIMLFAWRPAYADIAAALTEVYADNGLPDGGRPAQKACTGSSARGGSRATGSLTIRAAGRFCFRSSC